MLDTTLPLQSDVQAAINTEWNRLGRPGTWWSGEERIAIAQEIRSAPDCSLCKKRKAAVSPYAIHGEHDRTTDLPEAIVDTIHRITTDPGRLSEEWMISIRKEGLEDAPFVELVGIVATVITVDTFSRGIGVPLQPLPAPIEGEPSRTVPAGVEIHSAWVSTIHPDRVEDKRIQELYNMAKARFGRVGNILKAMTLVPDEQAGFAQFMSGFYIRELSITPVQREFLATTVSQLNDCFY